MLKRAAIKRTVKRIAVSVMAVTLALSSAFTTLADTDITQNDPYATNGRQNLALGKTVTSSSQYNMPSEGWCQSFVNDGMIGTETLAYGWSTNPYDQVADPSTKEWIQIDLGAENDISRVVLYPRSTKGGEGQYFPVDYQIQTSEDGVNFSVVKESDGNVNVGAAAQVSDFNPITCRYVRMLCTRQTNNGSGNYLVQLSEMAVYSMTNLNITLNKTDLSIPVGETEQLVTQPADASSLTWVSSDSSVAAVENGLVKAVSPGKAVITATDTSGQAVTCNVEVTAKETNDKFLISIFWPPAKNYVNAEQYDLLANAHVNFIQNVNSTDMQDKATNVLMAKLASERGMKVGVCDSRFANFPNMTDAQIESVVDEYKHLPGVGGYYLCDEPQNANSYARMYKDILKEDPSSIPYLNFLPIGCYADASTYEAQMDDFAQTVGMGSVKYFMYDNYPFGSAAGSVDDGMFQNMDAVRKVGNRDGIKTGLFIQSVGIPNEFRRTNANEIRYEISSSLAYGFKQISYFTWWTPTNQGQTFTNAIITPDGTPTDLYQPVSEINGEVAALGPTLMKLDAVDVYHSGTLTAGTQKVPDNFFFKLNGSQKAILSYMRDKTTGRNYVMVVNKSFSDSETFSFTPDSRIDSITEVDKSNGQEKAVSKNADGSYTLSFQPGEARLFAMPQGFDYSSASAPAAGSNLALGKVVSGSSSDGSNGWYYSNLTDGKRFSVGTSNGWESNGNTKDNQNAYVTVDMGSVQNFNRIDLYPGGSSSSCGFNFPVDFTIQTSADGNTWNTVQTVTDFAAPQKTVPSFKFSAVNARYVKINITKMRGLGDNYIAQLSELEVYNDDGSVPAPPATPYKPAVYTPGMNLALKKPVAVSSSVEVTAWGWSAPFINDGQKGSSGKTNGWSSATGVNKSPDSTEWAIVNLGDNYMLDKVVLYPRSDDKNNSSGFPVDYHIDVSTDGENWTTVATQTNDANGNSNPRTVTFDPIKAMFVRVTGTKLRVSGGDGYLMQIGELEAYGGPCTDKSGLAASINSAQKLKPSDYTPSSWANVSDALNTADSVNGNIESLQDAIDAAKTALDSALSALVRAADKTALGSSITSAETLDESKYTPSSWDAVASALGSAKSVFADQNALQSDVDKAAADLDAAVIALAPIPANTGSSTASGSGSSSAGSSGSGSSNASSTSASSALPVSSAPSASSASCAAPGGENSSVVSEKAESVAAPAAAGSSDFSGKRNTAVPSAAGRASKNPFTGDSRADTLPLMIAAAASAAVLTALFFVIKSKAAAKCKP